MSNPNNTKLNWAEVSADTPVDQITNTGTNKFQQEDPAVAAVTSNLASVSVDSKQQSPSSAIIDDKDDEEEVPLPLIGGLHPNDKTAQVEVIGANEQVGIYKSAETFEALGLSKELLNGVIDMKFVTPSKIQAQALPIIISKNHPNLIGQAHHGSGKCWAAGSELMLINGKTIKVENITAGAQLMGDDSIPRIVNPNSLVKGNAMLYQITPKSMSGQDYLTVNGDHILVLSLKTEPVLINKDHAVQYWTYNVIDTVHQTQKTFDTPKQAQEFISVLPTVQIIEISVNEFMSWPLSQQNRCHMYKPDFIEFPKPIVSLKQIVEEVFSKNFDDSFINLTAWILGMWLINGKQQSIIQQCPHKEILDKVMRWRLLSNISEEEFPTEFTAILQKYNVQNNTNTIPHELLTESKEIRMNLLCGMIDGTLRENNTSSYELQFLAKSLGFRVEDIIKQSKLAMNNEKCIESMLELNPEVNHWDFNICSVGIGNYYGFTVSGPNQRFLMKDFTVTHNTATFSLGVLSRIDTSKNIVQAVVVVPVRELARQVHEVMTQLAKFTKTTFCLAVPADRTENQEQNQPRERLPPVTQHVVVGTPGTIENWLRTRRIDNRGVIVMVVDEADQMIAQQGGTLTTSTDNIRKNFQRAQILLFSATFDDQVIGFARKLAQKAVEITVKTEELSLDAIKQFYMVCKDVKSKYETLVLIFSLFDIGQTIIFVQTVATAKFLATTLRKDGFTVSLLHGKKDMTPSERDRVMEDFRKGKTTVLIATNVLARGIDILSVTLVINFDIPVDKFGKPDPATYIHRIGRSGRFGRKGVAINFVHDSKSKEDLQFIANKFNKNISELPNGTTNLEKLTEIVKKAIESS